MLYDCLIETKNFVTFVNYLNLHITGSNNDKVGPEHVMIASQEIIR